VQVFTLGILGSTSAAQTPIRKGEVDLAVDCWDLLLFTSSLCQAVYFSWVELVNC